MTVATTKSATEPREPWKAALEPFGDAYARLIIEDFIPRLEAMSDDELETLIQASYRPTTTNCGWGEYQVAPIIRSEAKAVQLRRSSR